MKLILLTLLILSASAVAAPKSCLPRLVMVLPGLQASFPIKGAQTDVTSCWVDKQAGSAAGTASVSYLSISGDVTVNELLLPPDHRLKWNGLSFSRFNSMVLNTKRQRMSVVSIGGVMIPKSTMNEIRLWFQTRYVPELERAMRETL